MDISTLKTVRQTKDAIVKNCQIVKELSTQSTLNERVNEEINELNNEFFLLVSHKKFLLTQ